MTTQTNSELGAALEHLRENQDRHLRELDDFLRIESVSADPAKAGDVERAVKALPGVGAVNLNIVWQPFWSPDRIEPRVRAYMGL